MRATEHDARECNLTAQQNDGAPEGPQKSRRCGLFSVVVTIRGRTTSRPSIGNALSSIENPRPSLWRNAAPIFVHFLPVFPLLSYSSTVAQFADGKPVLSWLLPLLRLN